MSVIAPSPVRIIGTGLIGGSLGLALSEQGAEVQVQDASPGTESLAIEMGVGHRVRPEDPDPALVVIAAPPDVAASLVVQALLDWPEATVTDVASVKTLVLAGVLAAVADDASPLTAEDASRYVGSHPMAGREMPGVIAARGDLFAARPFVVVPHAGCREEAVAHVRALALDVGGVPIVLDAPEHDAAVAHVSHVPQVVASLLAGSLLSAPEAALGLAGQGLRDTTRIAASDPRLWVEILSANSGALTPVLRGLHESLGEVLAALETLQGDPDPRVGSRRAIAAAIDAGNRGVSRIPGKHGGAADAFATLTVLVPDRPGELARLLTEIGDIGINLEDLRLEHTMGRRVGLAHVAIGRHDRDRLAQELGLRGWSVADA